MVMNIFPGDCLRLVPTTTPIPANVVKFYMHMLGSPERWGMHIIRPSTVVSVIAIWDPFAPPAGGGGDYSGILTPGKNTAYLLFIPSFPAGHIWELLCSTGSLEAAFVRVGEPQ